jgi:spore maturation protein CgeB
VVNLGLGGIGYSESLTNVKTRDFEIPGTGGGVYLTSFNPDLAQHLAVGREILCYRNRQELTELTRWCLHHRDEADAIAAAGRARCLREHRWLHRYLELCRILGIVDIEGAGDPPEPSSRI